MVVVSWILLIVFGLIGLLMLAKFLFKNVNIGELVLMIFSIFVAALSAGVLFGGLTL